MPVSPIMPRLSTFATIFAVLFAMAFAAPSISAGAPPATAPSSEPALGQPAMTQPVATPKGLWTFETYGSYANQSSTREQLYSGTVGIGYYFLPDNSLTTEITGLQGTQPGPDVGAGAADLLLRTDMIHAPGWIGFIDFGPGVIESSHRIPPAGTDFNFFFKTGVGATVQLWGKTDLITGVRYLHISNAHLEGPQRNPSLNAVEGYLGLLVRF